MRLVVPGRHPIIVLAHPAHIRHVLQERANHMAPKSRFFDELEDHMSAEDVELTLRAVIGWGRYGEVFAYDDDSGTFSLENPT